MDEWDVMLSGRGGVGERVSWTYVSEYGCAMRECQGAHVASEVAVCRSPEQLRGADHQRAGDMVICSECRCGFWGLDLEVSERNGSGVPLLTRQSKCGLSLALVCVVGNELARGNCSAAAARCIRPVWVYCIRCGWP